MLWLTAAFAAQPVYWFSNQSLRANQVETSVLRDRVKSRIAKGRFRVWWQPPDGGELESVYPRAKSTIKLAKMRRSELAALYCVLQKDIPLGAELDLVVKLDDGFHPFSVWKDDRSLVISRGAAIPTLQEGSAVADIADRFGVAIPATDTDWEPRMRGALEASLAALTDEERAALKGLPIRRVAGRSGLQTGTGEAIATHGPDGIKVYDATVIASSTFVGDVGTPHHPAVAALVHELGHAVDAAPIRNGTGTPVRERFAEAFPGLTVTRYAAESPAEAFAEAFMLYRLDPAALERISPDALAWFRSGAHLGGSLGSDPN